MLIRRAAERDIPRIHELLAQVAQVHHTGRPDLFRARGRKYTDAQLSQKISDENAPIFVAVDGGERVLGYVFCQFEQYVNHNILTDVKTLYIDDLCVDEALRAQHIGGALYAYAAEFARKSGCYNLTLNVWSCNPSAIKFYESCGLRPQKVHLEALLSADGPGAGSAEAAPMIRPARPDDLPALGPVYGAARPRKHWGNKIVVTGFEHPSVQRPIRALKDRGFEVVEILPESDGHLDVAKLAAEVDKNTVLVSCMAVNNETGTLQDIAALSTAVKAKNSRCAVHVDAVQAWLRIPIDLKKWKNVDTLSVSGHKVHAPKGIGALFIRDSVRQTLCPPYLGGHQERGLRPGTENTPYIVGLGLAAAKGAKNLSDRNAHIRALNAQLRTGLEELAQQAPITLNSPADAVPEVLNFSTNCVNSQTFIEYLSGRHIYISGGSACDKGEPSHTLMAMGAPDLAVRTALRVSFCGDNTPEDVQALLDGLKDGLKELQHI